MHGAVYVYLYVFIDMYLFACFSEGSELPSATSLDVIAVYSHSWQFGKLSICSCSDWRFMDQVQTGYSSVFNCPWYQGRCYVSNPFQLYLADPMFFELKSPAMEINHLRCNLFSITDIVFFFLEP